MAYQENLTVNSHKHLLDLLETFLLAQGWTIDATVNAAEREIHVSKANGGETFFFALKSTGASSISLNGDLAYPSSGASGLTYLNLKSTAMVRAWFFAGDLYCHIAVEVANGYFQHAGFGRLVPYIAFAAASKEGSFVHGGNNTAWSTLVSSASETYHHSLWTGGTRTNLVRHVPVAGVAWGTPAHSIRRYYSSASASSRDRESWMLSRLPADNGQRPMLPIRVDMPNNPAVTTGYQNNYPLGYVPGMRVMNIDGVAIASEQTLGAEVWKRFPPPHTNTALTPWTPTNSVLGHAYLK